MNKSVWKKIGWFFVSVLPAFLSLVLQYGIAIIFMVVTIMMVGVQNADTGLPYEEMTNIAMGQYLDSMEYVILAYQVLGVLVFGLWYYLAYGKKKRPVDAEKAGVKGIAVIVLAGLLLQICISGALGIVDMLFPSILQRYIELMEAAGITEMTPIVFIATVILAPIGEEALCRGIIFRLAGKVSGKFWAANCIQALAFGIIHGNLVQGIYAFFLGLVFGYIYGKYHNIWCCMLIHAVVNFASNYVDILWNRLPESYMLPLVAAICIIGFVFLILCYKLLGRIKPVQTSEAKAVVPGETVEGLNQ